MPGYKHLAPLGRSNQQIFGKHFSCEVQKSGGMPPLFVTVLGSICLLAAASFSLAAPLQSKSPVGTRIEGVVLDQNDAAVSRALVVIYGPAFNSQTTTDDNGHFHFDSPPSAILTLTVTAKGFARLERKLDATVGRATEDFTNLRIVLAPASVSELVTVSATRTETRIGETAASVVVLDREDMKTTAALTLDDTLRQVPGFSLFRRSGSRTANPTTMGVSLRGLGASGASRAVVLADGIPLNDPFGGWVYWNRIPHESISQVEILRGSASHLYGSGALGGVINISTSAATTNSLSLTASYGNESTPDGSVFLSGKKRDWGASLATELFSTDGYVLVAPAERGPVDTKAGSRHGATTLKVERWFGPNQHIFGTGSFFRESRKNGTPLQTNRTRIQQISFGGELVSIKDGSFNARLYGGTQTYDQTFSAISLDRRTETLSRLQNVPVQFVGFSSQWSRPVGSHQTIVAGYESQKVRGASDEIVFVSGQASSLVEAGGRQRTYGAYVEDIIRLGSRMFINVGSRFDFRQNEKGMLATRPLSGSMVTSVTKFNDQSETAFSPQASGVYRINSRLSVMASGMRAFRAPTMNELYRSFRVGNVLTLANNNLRAERLTGGETGIRFNSTDARLAARASFFWNEINRPVANVTLTTTPALITRQRQNLGRTRSRGLEFEADARLNQDWKLSTGYLFADATVVKFPINQALEGLMIPQVARHQFTFQLKFDKPAIATVSLQGRASSSQFDDDQNLFRLGSYYTLDAFASRRVSRSLNVFLAAENLFNQRYEVGKTPVTTLGPPILVRAGLRVHLGSR
jgi:outer membrane receptor protein involved in Fe transport